MALPVKGQDDPTRTGAFATLVCLKLGDLIDILPVGVAMITASWKMVGSMVVREYCACSWR